MAVLLTPFFLQFLDNNGAPVAFGKVYTYQAGTSIPKATYTDFTEATPAANPVILDAAGRATIWISGSYLFELRDASNVFIRNTDNVTSFNTPASSANAFFQSFSGNAVTTAFALSSDLGVDEKLVLVFVDQGGGKGYDAQNPNAFTLTSGGSPTITFSVAPAAGVNNIYVFAPSLYLSAASASAAAAATSETNAAASAVLASQWATLTSGIVAATDYSAKAWSIGGTGVTGVAGKGASKEWATLTSSTVDTVSYSSKEYAQGTQASTGGSAKNWAQQTGADVTGAAANSRSAKSWAQDNNTGATLGGSAKDWAQSGSLPDGTNKSSKSYALDSQTSATAAAASQVTASAAAAAATAAATSLANEWLFASSIVMADPGTGNFRLDNATFGSVTNIALSALSGDSGNPNLRTFIQTWDDSNHSPRGIIRVEKNATNFLILGVNGALTDNTTWLQIPVTVIASLGSFSASDITFIAFTPYGNDGTGTLNASGTPTNGMLTKWASATTIANADLTGDVTTSGSLVTTIGASKVTNAMLAGSIALTNLATQAANTFLANGTAGAAAPTAIALAASQLAGRGAAGNIAAIALGTGLSMSGNTLNGSSGGVVTVQKQIFTSTGTYTPSTGMLYCIAEVVGSGAGGGGSNNSGASNARGGAGGGAGSYARALLTAAQIGASKAVTIGAGGTAGNTSGSGGGNGGDCSLGVLCVGKGGTGGAGCTTDNTTAAGGAGGVAGTGDVTIPGGDGQGSNLNANTVYSWGGFGGVSVFGPGTTSAFIKAATQTGTNGKVYGSGASGGINVNGGGGTAGGVGAAGILIITEFCSQ